MADTDERAAVAERAARAGARVANDRFRSDIDVETKGEDDVVTEADRAAQRTVIESIARRSRTTRSWAKRRTSARRSPRRAPRG